MQQSADVRQMIVCKCRHMNKGLYFICACDLVEIRLEIVHNLAAAWPNGKALGMCCQYLSQFLVNRSLDYEEGLLYGSTLKRESRDSRFERK